MKRPEWPNRTFGVVQTMASPAGAGAASELTLSPVAG